MTIVVIDTNIVLRFLLADEPKLFARASALFSEVRTGKRKAYLAESVAAECIFVLTRFYRVPKTEAAEKLSELLDYKGFSGSHTPLVKQALALFAAHSIAFVDALILAIAQQNGWHVETFDKALARLAASPGAS
jgi:predicted nucleic-acid-binding protein